VSHAPPGLTRGGFWFTLAAVPPGYKTKLHFARAAGGLTQAYMSEETGIPMRTYRRLENGELKNPPLRYLVNCAIALDFPLEDVCEDEWLRWTKFSAEAKRPTNRLKLRGTT
jgi:transcriptional regulator with XRE-family HTH domain